MKLAEINGSETFVHVDFFGDRLVVQEVGIRSARIGSETMVFISPASFSFFPGPEIWCWHLIPLRNRVFSEADVKVRALELADLLDLTPFLARRAAGLAADAKQKISLGRGFVRQDVAAILFDEPLTVIDPNLKWQLRCKLKEIHEQLKLTFVYVAHD